MTTSFSGFRFAGLAAACGLVAVVTPVWATNLGLPAASGVSSALWDTYPAVSFTGDAPDTADTAGFTATLDSANPAGMVLGGGDRLYSGSGATPNPFDLTINGSASQAIDSLSLWTKATAPTGGIAYESYFTVTLGGNAPAVTTLKSTSTEGSNTFGLVRYEWTGLSIGAGDAFTIAITGPANHVSLDAVYLAVPEPASLGLLGVGLAALARRRRA